MHKFLRFCVFVFLCVALLLAGGTVDVHAQEPSLDIFGDIGRDAVYQVNDLVEIVFVAGDGGNPVIGITLTITHGGLTGVVMSNGGTTDVLGIVTVTGRIIADTNVYIQAEWPDAGLVVRGNLSVMRDVAQYPFLEIVDSTDSVTVGATLKAVFRAGYDGTGEPGIPLRITASPNINITSPIPVPGVHRTGAGGILTVRGTLQRANVPTHIRAFWEESRTRLEARADIPAVEGIAPLIIVVNSPDPKSLLKIGDTFTQRITIENRDSTSSSLPLSAWQMDVVYNPLMLEVVEVVEGGFLASDGADTVFYADIRSKGRIKISQFRRGLAPVGIVLHAGDIGTLLMIQFKILAATEEPLGLHNVRLASDQDERIAYSILVSDVYRVSTTHQSPGTTAQVVFDRYSYTFQDPDVHEYFPDVLRAFKNPEIQNGLNSVVINHFVRDPKFIRRVYPGTDVSIFFLLVGDDEFRALFGDEQFHTVLQNPTEIDELVDLIKRTRPRDYPEPEVLKGTWLSLLRATTLSIVSGNNQSGEVGKPLAQPFVVGVLDQNGKPLQGIAVTFTLTAGNGRISATRQMTDVYGQARTTLTLGSRAGSYSVIAHAEGIEQRRTFTAAATDSIDSGVSKPDPVLRKISGGDPKQTGEPGKELSTPFIVRLVDRNDNNKPLQGRGVIFTIIGGGGQLSDWTAITNEFGDAQVFLTLGPQEGENRVRASAVGVSNSLFFTATAVAPEEKEPDLYWINGNTLWYRHADGEKQLLLELGSDSMPTGNLALDMKNRRVYWTEHLSTGGCIRSASLDDKEVSTVKKILAKPLGITVDAEGERVYWTTDNGKIQRIKVDGSDFQGGFIKNLDFPEHIAFDAGGGKLYWTEGESIKWVDPDKPTKISEVGGRGSEKLGGIAVFDNVVYWTEQTTGLGRVRSMHRSGRDNKFLAVTESIPAGIAVDPVGERVYWTTADGKIQSVSLTGAIPVVVILGAGPATGIALGGTTGVAASPAAPSVSSVVSVENALLANYPNPFNPETWIPYQLSASADVSVSIYAIDGRLVRHLELGHQSAGVYRSRSRAAYWDGRNAFGERVASGLYFYTLTAGDFTATRKMLIRK